MYPSIAEGYPRDMVAASRRFLIYHPKRVTSNRGAEGEALVSFPLMPAPAGRYGKTQHPSSFQHVPLTQTGCCDHSNQTTLTCVRLPLDFLMHRSRSAIGSVRIRS